MNKIVHIERFAQMYWNYVVLKKTYLSYLPIRFWIEPTNNCNLKCVMCPNSLSEQQRRGFIEFRIFKKIIDEIKDFAYDTRVHHRGESLLHPEIFEMIGYANRAGIKTELHTNATLLTEDRATGLLNSGLDFLSFSFDGFEKGDHERIRVNSDFDRTLSNIIGFLDMKRRLGRKKPFTVIEVIEFDNGQNKSMEEKVALISGFKQRFHLLPLDKFILKPPHNWGGSYQIRNPKSETRNPNYTPCTFPWFALVVLWDGTVLTCPQDFYAEYPLGNVKENSINEIWNNSRMQSLRKRMISKELEGVGCCQSCDMLYRPAFIGVPTPNIKKFLSEHIIGYGILKRWMTKR